MPFEFAKILCLRTAYRIRTKLIPLFGPDFVRQCLPPSHEDYGCLLLDPRSAPPSRSASHRRSTTAHHATAPSSTTTCARRVPRSEPYQRRSSCTSRPRRSSRTVRSASTSSSVSSTSSNHSSTTMSVARLLNDDMMMMGPQPTPSSSSSTTSSHRDSRSPTPVPSPSFTHLEAHKGYMHAYHHLPGPRLPPIRTATSSSTTTTYQHLLPVLRPLGDIAVAPPSPSEFAVQVSSSLPMGDDLNDTIRTALLLQRLSADTGERPFSTYEPCVLPKRVTVNDQVYAVSWEP